MDQRRIDLRLTWEQVAKNGEVSYEAVRAFRAGQPTIRRLTARGIEVGLQWAPGSIDAVLSGGEPTPEEPTDLPAAGKFSFDDLVARIYATEGIDEDRKREIATLVRQAQAQIQTVEDEITQRRRTA